jgi:hypothetical protein
MSIFIQVRKKKTENVASVLTFMGKRKQYV